MNEKIYIFCEKIEGVEYVIIQCENCHKQNGKGFFWGFGIDKEITCRCGRKIGEQKVS